MKQCTKCKETKPIDEFRKNGNGFQSKCKPCQLEYTRAHNQKNQKKYQKYVSSSVKKAYHRGHDLVNRHKSLCGCQKCGDKRYWLIDYHHIDPSQKEFPVAYYKTGSIRKLKSEIRKCITLCRNCHTDFHFQEKLIRITIKDYLNLK